MTSIFIIEEHTSVPAYQRTSSLRRNRPVFMSLEVEMLSLKEVMELYHQIEEIKRERPHLLQLLFSVIFRDSKLRGKLILKDWIGLEQELREVIEPTEQFIEPSFEELEELLVELSKERSDLVWKLDKVLRKRLKELDEAEAEKLRRSLLKTVAARKWSDLEKQLESLL